jgi:hypothetical protein
MTAARSHVSRPGGRPTKLTPELQESLCKVIQSGCHIETAAVFVGLHRATLHRWLRLGARARSGRYRDFRAAIQKAMAHAEVRDLLLIQKAGEFHWQAAAWRLERRYPKRWGRRSRDKLEAQAAQPTAEETAARVREFLAAADAMESATRPITPCTPDTRVRSQDTTAGTTSHTVSEEIPE